MKFIYVFLCSFFIQSVSAQKIESNELTQNFINKIENAIHEKRIVNELVLTPQLFISLAPEDQLEEMKNNMGEIIKMAKGWNASVSNFIDEISVYKKVQILSSEFKLKDTKYSNSYFGNLTLLGDNTKIKYQFFAHEIEGEIYLRFIRKN